MIIEEYLTDHGLRITKQRLLLFNILKSSSIPLSRSEIERKFDGYNYSTLYRNIELFKKANVVSVVLVDGLEKFILAGDFNSGHISLICKKCSQCEILNCNKIIHNAVDLICQKNRFEDESHQIIIYGICSNCISN